jgi:Mrp family chromosome partitioning ATPase
VLPGKGSVGKSSVTTQVALSLVDKGFNVGVLDIDLTGPSLLRMFGLEDKQVHQSSAGWIPVYIDETKRLCVMSLGFLLPARRNVFVKYVAVNHGFVKTVDWSSKQ